MHCVLLSRVPLQPLALLTSLQNSSRWFSAFTISMLPLPRPLRSPCCPNLCPRAWSHVLHTLIAGWRCQATGTSQRCPGVRVQGACLLSLGWHNPKTRVPYHVPAGEAPVICARLPVTPIPGSWASWPAPCRWSPCLTGESSAQSPGHRVGWS